MTACMTRAPVHDVWPLSGEPLTCPLGFFLMPMMSRQKVALSSGCVTCALVIRRPVGRMKRSYFGGFRVKAGPTNVICAHATPQPRKYFCSPDRGLLYASKAASL